MPQKSHNVYAVIIDSKTDVCPKFHPHQAKKGTLATSVSHTSLSLSATSTPQSPSLSACQPLSKINTASRNTLHATKHKGITERFNRTSYQTYVGFCCLVFPVVLFGCKIYDYLLRRVKLLHCKINSQYSLKGNYFI